MLSIYLKTHLYDDNFHNDTVNGWKVPYNVGIIISWTKERLDNPLLEN